MTSSKDKVSSYLKDDEKQVFEEFCRVNDYTLSQGVRYLIQDHLMKNGGVTEEIVTKEYLREWFNDKKEYELQRAVNTRASWRRLTIHEKMIDELTRTVEKLEKEVYRITEGEIGDEQIAAITGQPVWKVKLWRYGCQNPRGSQITKALEPYEVIEGRWKRK